MSIRRIRNLQDVVDWDLCIGCGGCFFACDKEAVTLCDDPDLGIRPSFLDVCGTCSSCLDFCPGSAVDGDVLWPDIAKSSKADHAFGMTLEVWEGHAKDAEIRFAASSGGVLSALSLYCIEREGMEFVVHTGMDMDKPWLNKTYRSRGRKEILKRVGSRYSPSSPCVGLEWIKAAGRPCAFVGKPCDAAVACHFRMNSRDMEEKIGVVLTFFCAGTPNSRGTLDLLDDLDVNRDDIDSLKYRGRGWPGKFEVALRDGQSQQSYQYSYEESWGRLHHYRPWRCNICPHGLGRISDISCGDAWHKYAGDDNSGESIVLVRTERGREILHGAIAAGYLSLEQRDAEVVFRAQPNLLERRERLVGRLLAMHLMLRPTPRFTGFSLFRSWLHLPPWIMLKSVLGTLKRLARKRHWYQRTVAVCRGTRTNA